MEAVSLLIISVLRQNNACASSISQQYQDLLIRIIFLASYFLFFLYYAWIHENNLAKRSKISNIWKLQNFLVLVKVSFIFLQMPQIGKWMPNSWSATPKTHRVAIYWKEKFWYNSFLPKKCLFFSQIFL